MAPAGRRDAFAATSGNLLLAFTAVCWTALLLAHRLSGPRPAVVMVACTVALLLAATFTYAWAHGPRLPAWIALAAAFAASRSVIALATGRIFAARDAPDHIYGLPLHIVRTGDLSDGSVYSAYPALQLLLAEVNLATGLPLWEASALLAVLFGLATMALVGRTAEALWPGAGLPASAGMLVAFLAIPSGQLYQPMTLSILLFAFLAFLVARAAGVAWAPGLFVVGIVALGITHPYSAAVVGIALFVALAAHSFLGGGVRFLVPMAVTMGLGIAYVAYVGGDLTRFVELLRPNDATPFPWPDGGADAGAGAGAGGDAGQGTVEPTVRPRFSDAYLLVGSWAFRLTMLTALVGWTLAFWPRPLRALFPQLLAVASALVYLVSRTITYGLPVRALSIASVATAPFIGLALHRSPKAAAVPVVAVLAILAVVAPSASYQFFPWSKGDPAVHALDDPPETADLVRVFAAIEDGALRRSNPVSSHPVFHLDQQLLVRSYATTDRVGTGLHTHFIFRDDAVDFGYSTITSQAGNPARAAAFSPYPTEGQLGLLRTLDRFGDFGSFGLHRG